MLRLATGGDQVDPLELYLSDDRSMNGRPWVVANMISSIDGVTAVDGASTALGDDDDRTVFKAIRAVPDVIVVGSGTVKAEDYSPVKLDPERRARRAAMGLSEVPTLAIVSGRLSLDESAKVFSDPNHKPLLVTSTSVDPGRLVRIGDAADVVFLTELTAEAIIDHLSAASVLLLEGGPTLNGQFAAGGLIDELNLTISPAIYGGSGMRIMGEEPLNAPVGMRLDRMLMGDRSLFLRYLRVTDS